MGRMVCSWQADEDHPEGVVHQAVIVTYSLFLSEQVYDSCNVKQM